ncbi:MAG: hypothetical protein IJ588_08765 [Prevotella sp.]|nr:hypothetical protein [Prevotella sp.]
MTQTVTLQIIKSLVIESVKNETFKRGQYDKAIDPKAATAAYHEQAGDEAYHERILERSLYASVEELKSHLYDYISTDGFTTADNSISSSDDGTVITVALTVSPRFNKAYTQSLARLASKYIEDDILLLWWTPLNEKQAALYGQFVERDLQAIKRCFNKTAPVAPTVPYTTSLEVTGTTIELEIGEEDTVTYSLSDGAVDDIEVRIEDRTLIDAGRSEQGFTVRGKRRGHTYIELYSRHDPELAAVVQVFVTGRE